MRSSEWQATLRRRQRNHKCGFQLKLGPSLLSPEMYNVTKRPSIGRDVRISESQKVDLKGNIGFVGRHHIAVQDVGGRRLPAPIHITTYTPGDPITIQYLNQAKKNSFYEIPQKDTSSLSRWYKARRSSHSQKTLNDPDIKRNQKKHKEKARQEKETTVNKNHSSKLGIFSNRREVKQVEPVIIEPTFNKGKKYEKASKPVKQKIKQIEAKPTYESRRVCTKRFKDRYREPLSTRCSNACYRICCKLYCCITIILIMAGVAIFAF